MITHAADAAIAGEGGELGDPELVHELPEARVVGALQFELDPPGGGDHGRVLAGVRADEDVALIAVGA